MEGLQEALETARRNLESAPDQQKRYYHQSAKACWFGEGDQVLVRGMLFPNTPASPFPIICALGPCTYEVQCGTRPTQRWVIHINHLKGWVSLPPEDAQVLAELCIDPQHKGGGWDMDPTALPIQPSFG